MAHVADRGGTQLPSEFEVTDRTKVRRLPDRAVLNRQRIYDILDASIVCHLGFIHHGKPVVIPTGFVRHDDYLYLHGKNNSFIMKHIAQGGEVCVTVAHIDGLVCARSAFHHSVNYRSVCVFGVGEKVESAEDKMEALKWFTEGMIPGRWDTIRQPTKSELIATMVVRMPLKEASCKLRDDWAHDDAADMNLDCWAGLIPLKLVSLAPQTNPDLKEGVAMPSHIANYSHNPRAVLTAEGGELTGAGAGAGIGAGAGTAQAAAKPASGMQGTIPQWLTLAVVVCAIIMYVLVGDLTK